MSALANIKKHTIIVADTGDIDAIKKHFPTDATTNPSLILAAAKMPQYDHLLDATVEYAAKLDCPESVKLGHAMDMALVKFGSAILETIPGRVSTEVDARLSFDATAQFEKACRLIELYEAAGVKKSRVLIKLSSTWEGIQAAKRLESEKNIHCNLTLMFGMAQAVASAEAGVTLISPFVGRIFDWHLEQAKARGLPAPSFTRQTDPGVQRVTEIYKYYKQHGYKTQVMGASFRNEEQILGLVGCDLLTISPGLLEKLAAREEVTPVMLQAGEKANADESLELTKPTRLTEAEFRWRLNEDVMASEKLADGIRRFAVDAVALEKILAERLNKLRAVASAK